MQIYIIEILLRLLSSAVLDYRLNPMFQSMNLLINKHDCIFELIGLKSYVINRENKELYNGLYTQYKDKKMKKNEKKIIHHFTEQDSKNQLHPMRLQGSNPYLL